MNDIVPMGTYPIAFSTADALYASSELRNSTTSARKNRPFWCSADPALTRLWTVRYRDSWPVTIVHSVYTARGPRRPADK